MNTIKTVFIATTFAALGAAASPALAQATMDPGKMGGMMTAESAAAEMSDGEVRKIDKAQGKLTLRHGPIKNLDMPGMTMVFTVSDKAMLDSVKVGDKVKFKAMSEDGRMTVVALARVK